MGRSILNIAGGKITPITFPETEFDLYHDMLFLVNLDQMYLNPTDIKQIISEHDEFIFEHTNCQEETYKELSCNMDIYEFLERYHLTFDGISMYRFLEHVPKVKVLYFLYLLSTAVKVGGYVDIIVPDYKKLAKRILTERVFSPGFEAQDIITTFELLNEPYCPHASIWTERRLLYFLTLEGRFRVECIKENYEFDGRDIYLRALAVRVK